jgi:hypothetical protein
MAKSFMLFVDFSAIYYKEGGRHVQRQRQTIGFSIKGAFNRLP